MCFAVGNRYVFVIGGSLLLAIAVAVMVFSFGHSADTASASNPDGLNLEMSLSVDNTVTCPPAKTPKDQDTPLVCVLYDATFNVSIDADAIPDVNGYQYASGWINYGDELGDQAANGAVKAFGFPWPDLEGATFQFGQSDEGGDARLDSVLLGGTTGLNTILSPLVPSFYTGSLFTVSLTCTSGDSNTVIELIQEGTAPAGTSGASYTDFGTNKSFRPAVTDIEVSCVQAPEPVGGIALDAELRALPLETSQPSGLSVGVLLGVAVAAALGFVGVTLGSAAWHARRRFRRA